MINFLEAVKHQLHQFVETGHCKPVHLMQNYLINDIYHAIDNKQMVMLASNHRTYKGTSIVMTANVKLSLSSRTKLSV